MMGGLDGELLFQLARGITPDVVYFLPRNVDKAQASLLAGPGTPLPTLASKRKTEPNRRDIVLTLDGGFCTGELCELERNKVNKKIKSITAYFGSLVRG